MEHPDQDKDILPPGYKVEPLKDLNASAAIDLARSLAFRNHVRNQSIRSIKEKKLQSMQEIKLKTQIQPEVSHHHQHQSLSRMQNLASSKNAFDSEYFDVMNEVENKFQGPIYGILPTPGTCSLEVIDEFQ